MPATSSLFFFKINAHPLNLLRTRRRFGELFFRAQKISRILEVFAARYYTGNPEAVVGFRVSAHILPHPPTSFTAFHTLVS